jgi:uncharacterized protein (DUF2147 family)
MKAVLLILLSTFTFNSFAQTKADDILGRWLSESGKAKIDVFQSGDKYYGKITWLKNPNNKEGQPKTDMMNPDPAKHSHKLIGLLLLKSLSFDGKSEWNGGTIYDPENGKEYSCKITLGKDGVLHIRGYIGLSLIGRTTSWKRVTD